MIVLKYMDLDKVVTEADLLSFVFDYIYILSSYDS